MPWFPDFVGAVEPARRETRADGGEVREQEAPTGVVIPPAWWTIVMSCGVVSIDLHTVHQPVLSAILLWFSAAVWLVLVVVLVAPLAPGPRSDPSRGRLRRDHPRPAQPGRGRRARPDPALAPGSTDDPGGRWFRDALRRTSARPA